MDTERETWDFPMATTWAMVFSAVLFFTFIFLPWLGPKLSQNAARLMADNLYGSAGAIVAPYIWIVPIAALIGLIAALLGAFQPERSRLGSWVAAAGGLAVLLYFALNLRWEALSTPRLGAGVGYWIAAVCAIGMVLQVAVAHPALSNRLQSLGQAATGAVPKLPASWVPYLFLTVPLLLYLTWIIGPTLYTIFLSLTGWDGVSAPNWVGLANYQQLLQDSDFSESLGNNLRWLLVFITIPTTLGLLMAMVFNNEMPGGRFFKISFYAPLVLSLPVIGLVWEWVYNPDMGLVNNFLSLFGVARDSQPAWLGDRDLAIWCVIATAIWRQVGYVMVLYLAGLKNIDPTLIDAARVDGAGRWSLFRFVIFPLLAPITTIIVVISVIDSLRAFDLVSVMTRGGNGTQVLANFMYIQAFNNYRMGYGAAIAVVLFAISLVFIGFYLSRVAQEELEY
jgi:ABC-type sugar transport system permease subunit